LTRKQLLEHALGKSNTESKHVKECPECREWITMLKNFYMADRPVLPDAPKSWVEKAVALARSPQNFRDKFVSMARKIFDSWAMPIPEGVRGESLFDTRRVRFQASKGMVLDLQAEFRNNQWEFVARLIGKKEPGVILKVGKAAIGSDEAGFYQWSGKKPPRKISILFEKSLVELPELKWVRPKLK
jgi:hypothetical protein